MARPSSKELLSKLAKASVGAKTGVLAAAAVLLFGLYYYLFYSDMLAEENQIKGQITRLAQEETTLQKRKQEYVQLLQEKKRLEEELQKNAVKLPTQAELPAFFKHLQVQAGAANVDLVNWSRGTEVPVDKYFKVPVKMEVKGTFYQLNHYFKLLYETPRIITVEELSITARKTQSVALILRASFVAATFRQGDTTPKDTP